MTQPPNTIHYSQLQPSRPDDPCEEWDTFLREIGRLIAEGHEGKWVLLKGDQIVELFNTREEARDEGYNRFHLTGFLIQHVATWQPVLRSLAWWWYRGPTPTLPGGESMTRLPRAIHYSQLPPSRPDDPCEEWDTFLREIGRLIAEGHEGKWVLLKGDQIVELFNTREEARDEGYRRFHLTGFLIQHVLTYQPILRSRAWYWYQCPTQTTP